MIIEILDAGGLVITKVANVGNPNAEVAAYGGEDWRPYVETESELTSAARVEKIAEIEEYRTETLDAAIDDAHIAAETMYLLWPILNTVGADPKWSLAYEIWDYAKTKINQMNALPRDQVEAYDPATDPNWPT